MKNTITISMLLCLALSGFAQPIEMPLKPMSYFNNDTVAYLRYNYPIKPFSEFQDYE
ncbi:MAG: hypothetical protein LBR06_00005 [Bacteroidales bacterium]|jgi:hypothetical protein|nr:hypothetical protein [Bacteroidales bacterium]